MDQVQAQQDLAYIREMMQSARQATYISAPFFIVWAVVSGLGLFGTWLLVAQHVTLPIDQWRGVFWLWIVMDALGFIGTIMIIRRNARRVPAANPAGRLVALSWFSVAVAILLIGIVGTGSGTIGGEVMCAISSILIGVGIFNGGILSGMKWMRNLAFGWWIGGALMLASPGLWNLWFMALMLFGFYFIPGIVLSCKERC
jgi:hypothetical protein